MPQDTHHPLYDKSIQAVELVRDCLTGSRQVKRQGTKYLPMLFKQSQEDYNNYVQRSNFFNAVKRTLSAFVGFVFVKNPDFAQPDSMAEFSRDCTIPNFR